MKKSTLFISGLFVSFFFVAAFMTKLQAGSEIKVMASFSQIREAVELLNNNSPAVICGSSSQPGSNGINGALSEFHKRLGHDFEIKQLAQSDKGEVCALVMNKAQL
jgi:hypothetical protein